MFNIGRFLSMISRSASLLGAICVIVMMLHVTADVAGRYLFNAPVTGTIVFVANYYMIFIVFIALGVAEEQRAHISVEIVTDLMPPRVQSGLSIISGGLTTAVIAVLMIGGYTEAVKKTNGGATMEQGSTMIEVWQSYWMIPIGAGLMAVIALYRVVTEITGWRNGLRETNTEATFINE